jgi:primosomal protein N' (replication factor Y)
MTPEVGTRVLIPLGKRRTTGIVWEGGPSSYKGEARFLTEIPDEVPVLPSSLHSLLQFGAWYYRIPLGSLARFALPPSFASPKKLSARFWKEFHANSAENDKPGPADLPPLTSDQREVYERWNRTRQEMAFAPTLLEGITGSGKTRLYQEMARTVLSEGKSVLALTPEIGLVAPLLLAMEKISGQIQSIHSHQTVAQRGSVWARILSGKVRVVVGPRSAIFAPLQSLGLIIIDEEHDSSYQAYEGLSFNARNLAIKRAQLSSIPVVLGSATPLSDSVHLASKGRYHHLHLPRRVGGFPLPPINFLPPATGPEPLPDLVAKELEQTFSKGEQAIILLNRRGYVPTLSCRSCNTEVYCPSCSVKLVYHKVPEKRLICHFCASSFPVPTLCPSCRCRDLEFRGLATQKLEERLSILFPSLRISRLDLDQKENIQKVLDRFREGEGDLLIGTQVVAKGHDMPRVTCGIVLDADAMLGFPDYRASERAFGLWIQLAGRVGRHRGGGRVTIVTREPEKPIFRWVREYDTPSFYDHLLEERKMLGYPPFCRIASVVLSSASEEPIREIMDERPPFGSFPPGNGIYGPIPGLPPKLRNRYRAQILVKAPTIGEVHRRLAFVRDYYRQKKRILVEWQVDPLDLT